MLAIAKFGSMPAVVAAIREMVPVGATDVTLAWRTGRESANLLSAKAGKGPRVSARQAEAACAPLDVAFRRCCTISFARESGP